MTYKFGDKVIMLESYGNRHSIHRLKEGDVVKVTHRLFDDHYEVYSYKNQESYTMESFRFRLLTPLEKMMR